MRSGAVPGFLPSRHGFAFANRWPAGPAFELRIRYLRIGVGEVAEGLCAGMCFAAADRFVRGEVPPTDTVPPARGTPLFHEIARRQLDSLHWLVMAPFRFWWTAARLRVGRWMVRDQVRQWLAIREEIDAGRPAMLGLVRTANVNPFSLTANHEVLGFAYEAGPGEATIRIYDPNHPGSDDVAIRLRIGGVAARPEPPAFATPPVSLEQTTGEPLLALLHLPYRPVPAR
ncbi:MAG: hypothetical protein C0498_09705 [Anaerolinea sp.]|nr:hypothetical protein [Anaerolinea sp.]